MYPFYCDALPQNQPTQHDMGPTSPSAKRTRFEHEPVNDDRYVCSLSPSLVGCIPQAKKEKGRERVGLQIASGR
jgi:hypothetical protein